MTKFQWVSVLYQAIYPMLYLIMIAVHKQFYATTEQSKWKPREVTEFAKVEMRFSTNCV